MASYSIMFSFLVYIFSSYFIQLLAEEDIGFMAPVRVHTFNKEKYLPSGEDEYNFLIPADQSEYRYVVELNIGNPPQVLVFHLDTASYLTWMESALCHRDRCFQSDPLLRFDPRKSTTYTESFTETECLSIYRTSIDPSGNCIFYFEYADHDWTRGNLAKDTLSVIQDKKKTFLLVCLDLPFVFGTSQESEITHSNYSAISGIFGLLPMNGSLLDQLKLTKFSYCFFYDTEASNFIYFGNQASLIGSSVPFGSSRNPFYSVALYGISVNRERLAIPDKYLRTTQEEENLILDSGTAHTWLYGTVILKIEGKMRTLIGPQVDHPSLLCFQTSSRGAKSKTYIESQLPKITLHLENYDFTLPNIGIYRCNEHSTCCLLFHAVDIDERNKIGITAQINHNVGYDLTAQRIYFQEKDCTSEE